MTTAPNQVQDFLASSAPLDQLPKSELSGLIKHAKLLYLSNEDVEALLEANSNCVFLIASGQFSVKDSDRAERHLSEGDYFGFPTLLDKVSYPLEVKVDSAGLVYCFPLASFDSLLAFPGVERFFQGIHGEDLQNQAVNASNSMWLYKSLQEVIERSPVKIDASASVQSSAQLMSEQRVSSLLVTQDDKLKGIVTDRDLRNRVVAQGLDVSLPISQIMTEKPAMISQTRTMFDAIALMSEHNIHHLPVVDRNTREPIGMLTASDVIRHQKGNVLFIIGELSKAENLYELSNRAWQLPHYFAKHAKRSGDFDIAGKVLSQATDVMTRKLIAFFQQQNGNAPMAYSWIVYGSQAREDQTMGSDQDNGLLLAREPNNEEAAYFEAMADYVCGGLGKCGIKLCDGNIMASNPRLRLSLDAAVEQAKKWVNSPTNEAILHFNIFLDSRCAAGDVDLFRKLQHARKPLLKQNMFLAALARQSNQASVPLSMFQKFVYEKNGPDKDCIDLKVRAIALINNLVRLYALANGLTMPSTLARLASMPADAGLSTRDRDNLRDIWLFLNRLRWRHQLTNDVTDNCVSMKQLSSIEKHQLKAAFKAIDRAQQAAVMKFSGGVS